MVFTMSKTLNNGVEIPVLGLGVFESASATRDAVRFALETGYRHIDTAKFYGNEQDVFQGIIDSNIPRKEVFVTTKIWNDDMRAYNQREVIEQSIENLGGDYIDMLLIHWPVKDVFVETWKIMEEYYKKGCIRAIGVSNFHKHHMEELLKSAEIIPVCNQIELHPYLSQVELVDYNSEHDIATECWGPLARGKIFSDDTLQAIADKYDKTVSQIVIRWEIQRGLITIPKSVHPDRIIENFQVFDFELNSDDMKLINNLNENKRMMPDVNPDTFTF